MVDDRISQLGERIARLETEIKGVNAALDRGSVGFERFRQELAAHGTESRKSIDELKAIVSKTHDDCAKHGDLSEHHERIEALETFRDKAKRYGWITSGLAAVAVGLVTLFGPNRVADAVLKLLEKSP